MDYSDPNNVPLVLAGKKAFGAGKGVPEDGLIRVKVTKTEWRKSRKSSDTRYKSYLTLLCLDNLPDYEIYDNADLPTPQIKGEQTRNGHDLTEIAERKMKTKLIAKGMDIDTVNGLTGDGMNVGQYHQEILNAELTIWYYGATRKADGSYGFADIIYLVPANAADIRAGTAQPPKRFNTDVAGGASTGGTDLSQQGGQSGGLGGLGGGLGSSGGGLGGGQSEDPAAGLGSGLGGGGNNAAPRTAQPVGGAGGLVQGLTG